MFHHREQREHNESADDEPDGVGFQPTVLGAGETVDEGAQAHGDEDRPGQVIAGVAVRLGLLDHRNGGSNGDHCDRDVHQQAPAPVDILGQSATQEQSDGRATSGDRTVDSKCLGALFIPGERGGEDRKRGRCDQRREHTLTGAGDEQFDAVLCDATDAGHHRETDHAHNK